MLPEWMKEVEIGPCQCCAVNVGKKKSFVEKSISGVLNFFQESLISEDFAKRDGLLQSLDPRVKLISAIVLVVAVSLTRDVRVLFASYLLILLFACLLYTSPSPRDCS